MSILRTVFSATDKKDFYTAKYSQEPNFNTFLLKCLCSVITLPLVAICIPIVALELAIGITFDILATVVKPLIMLKNVFFPPKSITAFRRHYPWIRNQYFGDPRKNDSRTGAALSDIKVLFTFGSHMYTKYQAEKIASKHATARVPIIATWSKPKATKPVRFAVDKSGKVKTKTKYIPSRAEILIDKHIEKITKYYQFCTEEELKEKITFFLEEKRVALPIDRVKCSTIQHLYKSILSQNLTDNELTDNEIEDKWQQFKEEKITLAREWKQNHIQDTLRAYEKRLDKWLSEKDTVCAYDIEDHINNPPVTLYKEKDRMYRETKKTMPLEILFKNYYLAQNLTPEEKQDEWEKMKQELIEEKIALAREWKKIQPPN